MRAKIVVTVVSAIAAFAATNIDNLFILTVLFGQGNTRRRVLIGQYLGFAAIIGLSAAIAFGALTLPRPWVGMLGIGPLFLGLRGLVRLRRGHHDGEPRGVLGTWSIALVTLANGGDNIAVYTPMFTTTRGLDLAIVLAVFAGLISVWCAIAHAFVRVPRIAKVFDRWGRRLAPLVLIALGVYVLFDAGSASLLYLILR